MSAPWMPRQNMLFETVLAIYDKDTPDRRKNMARAVGDDRSDEEVKSHYEGLTRDAGHIEVGDLRQFSGSGNTYGGSSQEQRACISDWASVPVSTRRSNSSTICCGAKLMNQVRLVIH